MGAVLDLVKVLYEPAAVFERVREKPGFLAPFAGLAVVQIILGALMLPYTKAAMHAMMAQATQQAPAGAPDPSRFALVGVIAAPIGLVIALVLAAVILWVLLSLFGEEAKFGLLLNVATYAAVTNLLLGIAGLAVLNLKGVASVTSTADLQPALGLDLLVPEAGRWLTAVLKAINPFSLWGVALTGIGITTTHRVSKGTGYTVAAVAFLLGVMVFSVFALLGPGGSR